MNDNPAIRASLARAHEHLRGANAISAELELRTLVAQHPGCIEAWLLLSELAGGRGDDAGAQACLAQAHGHAPGHAAIGLQLGYQHLRADRLPEAVDTLVALLRHHQADYAGWLMLGQAFEYAGKRELALRAWVQGLQHGQTAGRLMNMESTPPVFRPVIQDIIGLVNAHKYDATLEGLARMREQFGAGEVKRLERALAGYLGQQQETPPSPHQRPKFLYFPGLPEGPWHDPHLHPWTAQLLDAYDDIRLEALEVLRGGAGLEEFLEFAPGQSRDGYLGGTGSKPSWDAFFFYRHGQRYDANHLRCPKSSAVLDRIELCRVERQAPEICFSVLQPGTRIMPHHGVTNTRLVLHLPLLVPPGCALKVAGGGEHAWREREPMMFDDTFEHEAWNHSDQQRVVLLMDCWNPHLTTAERIATRKVVELIGRAENFTAADLAEAALELRH